MVSRLWLLRGGLLVLAVVAGAGGIVYLANETEASPKRAFAQLQCATGAIESTDILYATPEKPWTETPEELAARWESQSVGDWRARGVGTVERRTVDRSHERVQVGFIAGTGQTLAVLTMSHAPTLGWYIETIDECA